MPDLLESAARHLYEEARKNVAGRPKWEDLNPSDPYDMGMRAAAFAQARALHPDLARPYSPDEQRVCDYLQEVTDGSIGCGDDPIGFLIASHAAVVRELRKLVEYVAKLQGKKG